MSFAIAKKQGYKLAFTLEDGLADERFLNNIPRLLISGNPSLKAFANTVIQIQEPELVRVMHVDLDYVYDRNKAQLTRNIDKLVQRVYDMKISHVFLQAYSDPLGDGNVTALYFPNRHLPVRADIFNFIAWQLQTRAKVKVYAWMPVLSFHLAPSLPRVQRWDPVTGHSGMATAPYVRLSPWNGEVRQQVTEIYEDLARYASFDGILFHDDAVLTDVEDVSPDALTAWKNTGSPFDISSMAQTPDSLHAWTRFKSQTLIKFTQNLSQAVKKLRGPQIKTARNIFALPVIDPASEDRYAQNFDDFLVAYDWTVPIEMPLTGSMTEDKSNAWLTRLVNAVAMRTGAMNRTIFELHVSDKEQQARNAPPDRDLIEKMRQLRLNGVNNYGYSPDDFIKNQPDISHIRPEFSSYWYPNND